MEFNYSNVEKVFADYIINLIGPNEEQNLIRENKFETLKLILESVFKQHEIKAHTFIFGSFPIRTYLPESDLDVTIVIENSEGIIENISKENKQKIFSLIELSMQKYNQQMGYQHFSEIKEIPAEVKLLKCNFDNIAFDISINNFVGLQKLCFINHLEDYLFDKIIFKKSLLLIKSWSSYESNILGSSNGLMASYALEVLVIYIFIVHFEKIKTEIDALFIFFEIMKDIDWDKQLISIFGTFYMEQYFNSMKINSYDTNLLVKEIINSNSDSDLIRNNSKIIFDELNTYLKKFEHLNEFDKMTNTNKKLIDIKLMNILDPLFPSNNLGKSLNFNNFSKIQSAFEIAHRETKIISNLKNEGKISAISYLNMLINLFSKVVINNDSDLYDSFLFETRILSADLNQESELLINYTYDEINLSFLTEEIIKQFNTKFSLDFTTNNLNTQNLIQFVYLPQQEVYLSRSIFDFFINENIDVIKNITKSKDVLQVEKYLFLCKTDDSNSIK